MDIAPVHIRRFARLRCHRFHRVIYIYIDRERERERERDNKSTMPENAEKYFYGPTGIRTHDLGNTA